MFEKFIKLHLGTHVACISKKIFPSINKHKDLNEVIKYNIINSKNEVMKSEKVRNRISFGRLQIKIAEYMLDTGSVVEIIEKTSSNMHVFVPRVTINVSTKNGTIFYFFFFF